MLAPALRRRRAREGSGAHGVPRVHNSARALLVGARRRDELPDKGAQSAPPAGPMQPPINAPPRRRTRKATLSARRSLAGCASVVQYCGSCWAFAALSSLNDRIKIMRRAQAPDIHLSVQHLLNCGSAGTCNGGNSIDVYSWSERPAAALSLPPRWPPLSLFLP